MKLIITGATGFVGRNLAETFHREGHEIVATGRSEKIGRELQDQNITFYRADLLDTSRLEGAFSPADCVIHCAARIGDWGKYQDFYETNVVGTDHVIELCRSKGIKKIIYVSTPSVYVNGKDRLNIKENDELQKKQLTHYGRTKLMAEEKLLALRGDGFQVMIFRPRAVLGPYDLTFVPRILRMARRKKFPLINDGRALTDITSIDNFVDAVRAGLKAEDNAWNEIYNISNGQPISIREWFGQILELFDVPFRPKNIPAPMAHMMASLSEFAAALPFGPSKPFLTRFSVLYMSLSMTMSIEKAAKLLDYEPKINNTEIFERYAQWYRSMNPGL